jgi:hypothetical protein
MFSALGRVLVVTLAFLIAITASAVIAFQIGQEQLVAASHADGPERVFYGVFSAVVLFLSAGPVVGLPFVLALGVVIVGEVARIRLALYYIAGGGLAAAAIPLLVLKGATPHYWQVFATAGFVGGAIYWALAGRKA